MDTWEAWNLGIKLPEVVEGELLDPDTAYKDMQKQGFAYSKMYYGQPEADPEPNQGDSEEQSNVNEGPAVEGDMAVNDSGTQAMSPGNNGGTKGGGMKQGGSQGNQQAGGMKQGGSQGSQQAGGMKQGGSQGSQQAGGMKQGGSQGGGFSQGGSSSQGAFDSAWQGGSLSQGGGMNNNSGGMNNNSGGNVAWNQSGSSKKSAYSTAGSGNSNRQGGSQSSASSQGGQTQLPQLPGGNSMQFQKYQKNQKSDNKSPQQSGGNYSQGGGGGTKSNSGAPPMPDDGPMKEVKAPRGWSGGTDDGISTKNLPGYAIGSKPVTEGVSKKGGGKETSSLKAAPIGYEVGDAPVSADSAEEWQMSAKTSSGAVLWYRVTNAGSGASSNPGST